MNTHQVSRSMLFQGAIFVPGTDYELTSEQTEGLRKRDALIENASNVEALQLSDNLDKEYEIVASDISGRLGVLRNSEETGQGFVEKIVRNSQILERKLAEANDMITEGRKENAHFQNDNDAVRKRLADAQAELGELKRAAAQPPSTPAEPLAALKTLGLDVVSELIAAGFDTPEKIVTATDEVLDAVPNIGPARIKEIRNLLK